MLHYSKRSILALTLATVGTVAYAADATTADQHVSVKPFMGEKLAKNANVTMADARVIALKAHSGKITDEELENEKGGSGLRYSFDIKSTNGTQEVGVDAKTGIVLENKREGPNPD
ncbi:PepSY domain-containing protein [Allopusillimonas ginsengisoli]|uniref:PepSY domain-containing protein n=1 Tax=Allopusillimonas ginsengisoli TaxID=453575 RepID=UPI0039C41B0B